MLINSFYLKMFLLSPRDHLKVYPKISLFCPLHHLVFPSRRSFSALQIISGFTPKIFPTFPLLVISCLPQNINFPSWRKYQFLHPKFSLCVHKWLPQILFSSPWIISHFPSKFSLSVHFCFPHFYKQVFIHYSGHYLAFYPQHFPYLPNSDYLLFTSKYAFFLLQSNSDFMTKMSILSPIY